MRKHWYQAPSEHFDEYDQEPYSQKTAAEVNFQETVIAAGSQGRILDVSCRTGRFAHELTCRGYQVTSLDQSTGLLEQASRKADRGGALSNLSRGMPG